MPSLENLRRQQLKWYIHWRWEGVTGHPRHLADTLVETLEDRGYTVSISEGDLRSEPLSNTADFEGIAVALRRQSTLATLKERWKVLTIGAVFPPALYLTGDLVFLFAFIGLIIWALFFRHKYRIGLQWRGEAYSATGYGEIIGGRAERASTISNVRLTLRVGKGASRGNFEEDLDAVVQQVESMLPRLVPGSGR